MTIKYSYFIAVFFAVFTILLGISVLIGWHFNVFFLIQYYPDTIAMVYNTGLSFIVAGLCILFLLYGWRNTAQTLSLFILLLSTLVLSQTLLQVQLSVDQLFFYHQYNVLNAFPGRMAPNTCLSFIISSLVIICLASSKKSQAKTIIASLLILILLFLSALFISGYYTSLQTTYEWSTFTPMAFNTAVGFILLSTSLFASLLYYGQYSLMILKSMPILVGTSMFFINSLLAIATHQSEYSNNSQTYLPWVIFTLGTGFTIIFSLMLFYALKSRRLFKRETRFKSMTEAILQATADGILALDIRGRVLHTNNNFLKIWDLSEVNVNQCASDEVISLMSRQVDNPKSFIIQMSEIIRSPYPNVTTVFELRNYKFFEVHCHNQQVGNAIIGQVLSFHDISQTKKLEQELMHRNTHDALTNLPNKAMIFELLTQTLLASRNSDTFVAAYIIDIDRFSQLNDVYGRSKGDTLIKAIAWRLQEHLAGLGSLCRLGGDEFILIRSLVNADESEQVTGKILNAFKEKFEFFDASLNITCGIGIAFSDSKNDNAENLLRCADIALVHAKNAGHNSFAVYNEIWGQYTNEKMALENELHTALKENQFTIHYQPIIDLPNQKVHSIEALLRWEHPTRGLLSPDKFIHIAEDTGLIIDIGQWVLKEACHQIYLWQQLGIKNLRVAVNISAQQLRENLLVLDVIKALDGSALDPGFLIIELTEKTLIHGSKEINRTLNDLQTLGVTVAIDDFGIGYSNLNFIKNFPINIVKISKLFINDLEARDDNKNLVIAIINMAKSMRLKVLAEGIETNNQLKFLMQNACELGQGFYFSKPLTTEECYHYLSDAQFKKGLKSQGQGGK